MRLAQAILADEERQVKHLREKDVLRKAAELVEEKPERADMLAQDWRKELEHYSKKDG